MAGIDNLKPLDSVRAAELGKKSSRKGIPNTATRLKRFLELIDKQKNPVTGELEDMTVAEQMDLAIIAKARKGDIKAYQALLDRLEGKSAQSIDMTTGGESLQPLLVKFVGDDGKPKE